MHNIKTFCLSINSHIEAKPFFSFAKKNPILKKINFVFKFNDGALLQFRLNYYYHDCFSDNAPSTTLKTNLVLLHD